ncbi:DNA-binding SARP family transcriptional activator [Streptosporangium becharense]|uniref:DNA-binding SARP family transcriptional activator n=1 Tax=Streptosporangium becharense TaxID=1816182 RepID=A0A7W9IJM0_9ACTN|nr:BTAD domain-containing putative transcriptional regulator [Streptosporangium becharense]MBB2911136.1 DNA-binding SARP family transcriptional activator [Streptosporangium becharense]MBB5821806.1 DNA-binding SARP family transcriptional activator [Streptosporangium becharense]
MAADMVAFRVLGPVEAHSGEDELDLGGLRQRAVLARLLVARGQVVPVDSLLYDLWDDDAAKGAQSGLQVYISRLRRVLEPGRPRGGPNRLLVTVASGYALRAAPEQVDALRFESLVRSAGEQLEGDDPASARVSLEKALGLWRGTPYADFADQPWAEAEVNRLAELRLVARERHADSALRMGLPAEAVPDLEALTTEHPLREEGWRLLALGLYRCGRQGDALAAMRKARTILSDELGIDPGPALRKLESDILAQDPGLELAAPPPARLRPPVAADSWPPRPTVAPVELPPLEPEPFVGRDTELARLTSAASRAGRFTVAVVSGDAGAGKTTLLRRLIRQLSEEGWSVSCGACPDSSATPPGWAWVEILRTLVSAVGPGEYAQLLAPLLDDTAPEPDDEVSGGFRLHRAVGGYLAAVAKETPILLTLEDLHWADDQTLALLRALPSLLATSRVLLVVTCRDSELSDQQADVLAALARLGPVRVGLTGLDTKAVAELVRATCVREVDEDAVNTIVERTGGNPFFIRETVRLLDAEAVSDRATAAEVISGVPSGVRDVLRRRIARLPGPAQQILLQAAVIGRDVDVDVLVDVSGDEDAVVDAVEAALLAGLVTEPGPGMLRFDHDLVRDTLYSDASRLRRSRLHAAVASVIEHRNPGDVAALAHHYDAAGTADTAAKAVHYAGLAAEQAERRFAHREAATLWEQAIAAFDRSGVTHTPERTRERLLLTLRLIKSLALCGDMAAARRRRREAMDAALPLGNLELTARVAASLAVPHKGMARDFTRTAWEIVDVAEQALVELPPSEQSLRASLLATLALELEGSATPRGEQASLEAEELARRSGDPALLATALSGRLRQSYGITPVGEREVIGRELLEVGRTTGQVAVQALAHLVLMECAAASGAFADADAHVAAAEKLAKQYGLSAPAAVVAWYAGQRLMIAGDFAGAERAYRDAARVTAKAGMLEGRQDLPLITAFCLHLVNGRSAEMVEPLAEAHQRGAKWTTDAYAVALASAGHPRDAKAVIAVKTPVRPDFLYELAMVWRALAGMLLDDRERMTEAYDTLKPFADRIAGAGTGVVALWPISLTLGDLALRLGFADAVKPHYENALAVAERVGVPRWVEAARRSLGD